MASSALARLKKAANLQPIKRVVTLNDGSTFEFYATALTMAERERAQKMPGGDDPNGFALNLLVTKAAVGYMINLIYGNFLILLMLD